MKTAFPQTQTTCSIRLYSNIPFDNTYKNHTIISNKFTYDGTKIYKGLANTTPCERFIDRLDIHGARVYPKYDITGDFNFNFTNGLVGSVTLELTPTQTNANYMRLTCGNDVYYYFITGITQNNFETYTLTLELDVIMTYQDEFLDGMADIPVFTARKHCHRYTDDGLMPACADFKNKEDTFGGVVANNIKRVDYTRLAVDTSDSFALSRVLWLYICCDAEIINMLNIDIDFISKYGDAVYPLVMLAIPINVSGVTIRLSDSTIFKTFSSSTIKECITKLVGNGFFHGAKVSHYPPFTSGNVTYNSILNTLDITPESDEYVDANVPTLKRIVVGGNSFMILESTSATGDLGIAMQLGCMLIENYKYKHFDLKCVEPLNNFNVDFINGTAPTITANRFNEPKLLFSPFTKYFISSQYATQGYEFYPELLFSDYITSNTGDYIKLATSTTSFIGDSGVYTYIKPYDLGTQGTAFNKYKYGKIGLASNLNYNMPVGTDALDLFNSTQRQSFQQSKVASGITSGLAIVGGVASIIGGASMVGTGNPMGAGLIATGAGAIASGVAGEVNTIRSADAKMEDLSNTPDNITISGGSFVGDSAVYTTDIYKEFPYFVIYETNAVNKKTANDFFYKNGYKVSRECYFNTALDYTATHHKTDDNIFGRTIFNYVQLNDDITNKINANIPLVVKQKLSSIFNNGITLWSFFGLQGLWSISSIPLSTMVCEKWFMKDTLDNTEYNIYVEQ